MIWVLLLSTAAVVYAVYRMLRYNQTTYFTQKFKIPPGHLIEVYVNGVRQQEGTDYREYDGIILLNNYRLGPYD